MSTDPGSANRNKTHDRPAKEHSSPLDDYDGPNDYIEKVEQRMWISCTQHWKYHSSVKQCECLWACCMLGHENSETGVFYQISIPELLGYNPAELALTFAAGTFTFPAINNAKVEKALTAGFGQEIVDNILWKYVKMVHQDKKLVDTRYHHFCLKHDVEWAQRELRDFEQKNKEVIEM